MEAISLSLSLFYHFHVGSRRVSESAWMKLKFRSRRDETSSVRIETAKTSGLDDRRIISDKSAADQVSFEAEITVSTVRDRVFASNLGIARTSDRIMAHRHNYEYYLYFRDSRIRHNCDNYRPEIASNAIKRCDTRVHIYLIRKALRDINGNSLSSILSSWRPRR